MRCSTSARGTSSARSRKRPTPRRSRTAVAASIVVESLLNDVRMLLPPVRGGYGLDGEWNEDFHHALLAFLTGERHGKYVDFGSPEQLARMLEQTFLLSGGYSRFRGRRWGASVGDVSGDRFVIGIQNHDHIGNRAWGERLSTLVSPAVHRMTASLMLLSPHLPFMFMGEEYGERNPFQFFCSFEDGGLVESVRTGRRRDYALQGDVPDPQAEATFRASRLSWSWPAGSAQAGLRQLYRDLLAARQAWPALRNWTERRAKLWPDEGAPVILEFIRGGREPDPQRSISCYFNLTRHKQLIPATSPPSQVPLFTSAAAAYHAATEPGERIAGQLEPYECLVVGPPDWRRFPECEAAR